MEKQYTIHELHKAIQQLKNDGKTAELAELATLAFTDLKETKDLILKMCDTFGIVENGVLKNDIKQSEIIGKIFKLVQTGMFNTKKLEEKFSFIKEFTPIIERYQKL